MAEIGIIASIIGVAGAGFRLSLLLNAVAADMANADCDIHNIAKGISLFSLMLKQVGKTMEEGRTVASQSAIETATEIRDQSELIFQELERMVNLSQGRDDNGNIRSITITEKVKWCFKKQKVHYLLGQLESLKLSLSIMLQILQMGKSMATVQDDSSKHPPTDRALLQERAEIQNMIVVQHWSLVELRKLYELAETEARGESMSPLIEDPPPRYDAHRPPELENYNDHRASASTDNNLQLTLRGSPPVPPKIDVQSQAVVKFQEKDLYQLDESFSKALTRENQVLNANVYDIVDHLLSEWTRAPQSPRSSARSSPKHNRHTAYYSSDESDTESDFEGHNNKGRYIEGARRSQKRGVHFQPSVESDQEDEERTRPRRRAPKRHVLHSDSDTSSEETTSTSPPVTRSQPHSRRSSDASNSRYNPQERHRTPYTLAGLGNVPENPARPSSSRGIPQSSMPVPARPQPQHYQSTPPNPAFRGPAYTGPPSGPPRLATTGSYMSGPSPGYMGPSPQPQAGGYFPQGQRPPGPPGPPMPMSMPMPMPMQRPPRQHGHRIEHRHEKEKAEKDRAVASKNLKRGLFAGAGLAGILDLLQGLDGL